MLRRLWACGSTRVKIRMEIKIQGTDLWWDALRAATLAFFSATRLVIRALQAVLEYVRTGFDNVQRTQTPTSALFGFPVCGA